MNPRAAASSSHPDASVGEAAAAALAQGGSALDAVVAGFFRAAGLGPGALFAPTVVLVAGAGAGARAFDGRAAQPGLGASRPRGFVAGEPIPLAARFAAPRSVAMVALAHARFGRLALRELVKSGGEAAVSAGSKRRAALVRRVGAAGVVAVRAAEVVAPLLEAAGPIAGGLLTGEDLTAARPEDEAAAVVAAGREGGELLLPPWPAKGGAGAVTVLASDARGMIAALAFEPAPEEAIVDDLEIALPTGAVPVARGVTRMAPGTPLASATPIALVLSLAGFDAAIGARDDLRVAAGRLGAQAFADTPTLRHASGAEVVHAIVRTERAARAMRG